MYRGSASLHRHRKSCRKHSSLKGHLWKLLTRARDSRPRRGELWTRLFGSSPMCLVPFGRISAMARIRTFPALSHFSSVSRFSLLPTSSLHCRSWSPALFFTLYCIVVLIMSRTRACSPQSRVSNTERQQRNPCAQSVASSSDTDAWWIGEREHHRERPKRFSEWVQLRRSQNIITLSTTSFLWRTALSPLISLFINDTLFTTFLTGSCRQRCP
jgi:hypothetical protein